MRTLTLTQLISQAKSRADMLRSGFVSTQEWTDYLNAGIVELRHELKAAYGEEYFLLWSPFTTVNGTDEYDLPNTFWALRALDVQIGGQWYPVHRFGMADRNRYQMLPAIVAGARLNNIQYALWGNKVKLIPPPDGAFSMRMGFEPPPDRLATLAFTAASMNLTSNTITIPKHGLRSDQLVRPAPAAGVGNVLSTDLRDDTDYWAIIVDKDTIQLAANAAGGGTATAIDLTDAGTGNFVLDCVLDGVAGWEEWPILSAAIVAKTKAEEDSMDLKERLYGVSGDPDKKGIRGMIQGAVVQRDSAEPQRIVNVHAPFANDAFMLGDW